MGLEEILFCLLCVLIIYLCWKSITKNHKKERSEEIE